MHTRASLTTHMSTALLAVATALVLTGCQTTTSPAAGPAAPAQSGAFTVLQAAELCPAPDTVRAAAGLSTLGLTQANLGGAECDFRYTSTPLDPVNPIISFTFWYGEMGVVPTLLDDDTLLTWPDLSPDAWGYTTIDKDQAGFRCTFLMPATDAQGNLGQLQITAIGSPGATLDAALTTVDTAQVKTFCQHLGDVALTYAAASPATPDEVIALTHARGGAGQPFTPDLIACAEPGTRVELSAEQVAACTAEGYRPGTTTRDTAPGFVPDPTSCSAAARTQAQDKACIEAGLGGD